MIPTPFLSNQLSVGDIVALDQPLFYAVELLGSWNSRCVEWYKDLDGISHLELKQPLSNKERALLRIIQVALLPLTLLCIALKSLWRRHLVKEDAPLSAAYPWLTSSQKSSQALLERKATVIIGASGSGKSTVCHQVLQGKSVPYIVVDSDDIKSAMPAYQTLVNNGDEQAAMKMHIKSCELRNQFFSKVMQSGQNLLVDATGSDAKSYEQYVINPLRKHLYKIHLIYVEADVANCLKRAQQRAQQTGRAVPEWVILHTSKVVKSSFEEIKGMVDSWEQYNNDGPYPILVAKGSYKSKSHRLLDLLPLPLKSSS